MTKKKSRWRYLKRAIAILPMLFLWATCMLQDDYEANMDRVWSWTER